MGYTYSFSDDEIYSAKDINDITKRLVTSGIEDDFSDGTPYNTGRLNIISQNIATEGVVPEDNTSLKVEYLEEGKIKINKGCAFLESGKTFTVDEEGVILDFSPTALNYVYIEDNDTLSKIIPRASNELPLGYDYLLLATVSAKGVVTDKRTFAKGKLPGYMSDFNTPKRFTVNVEDVGEIEVDIGRSDANFIMITEKYDDLTSNPYDSFGVWNKYDDEYLYTTGNMKGVRCGDGCFYLRPYGTQSYVLKVTVAIEGTAMKLNVQRALEGVKVKTRFEITVM